MTRDERFYCIAGWMASSIIGAILLSGYYKLQYPADFALAVFRFHLLPGCLVNAVALYVPWLEVTCAVALFLPRYRVAALRIVLVLLAIFTVAIAINLLRGSEFGCGCFRSSASDRPLDWLGVARNLGLIALALLALVAGKRSAPAGRPGC